MTEPRQCRACVHAHPIGDESMECRARAPYPVIQAVTSSRSRDFARAVWPTVEADDWCSWFEAPAPKWDDADSPMDDLSVRSANAIAAQGCSTFAEVHAKGAAFWARTSGRKVATELQYQMRLAGRPWEWT